MARTREIQILQGQTLPGIAMDEGIDLQELLRINRGTTFATPGSVINLPASKTTAPEGALAGAMGMNPPGVGTRRGAFVPTTPGFQWRPEGGSLWGSPGGAPGGALNYVPLGYQGSTSAFQLEEMQTRRGARVPTAQPLSRPSEREYEYPNLPERPPASPKSTAGSPWVQEQNKQIAFNMQNIAYNWKYMGKLPDSIPANPTWMMNLGILMGEEGGFDYSNMLHLGYTLLNGSWVRGVRGVSGWGGGGGGGGRRRTTPRKYSSTGRTSGGYDTQGALVSWRLGA